jgi:predicted  nucleic acid-binding Zn-ribbon protein
VPDPLLSLLDVQGRDIAADQLRHRRATLPERAQVAEQEAVVERLDVELAALGARLDELGRTQRRLEDDVASVETKRTSEHTRLYSGTVTSPRELQAMQEEIDALARRQRELEDALIEVMETVEPLVEESDDLGARRQGALDEAARLRAVIAEAEAVIDGDLAGVATARADVATDVPADLLAEYERLRARLGGVAVARLEGTQCSGCHLSLPATELDAVRHAVPGAVVHHEECGRILVR